MKATKKNNQSIEVNNNAAIEPQTERQSLRTLCKQLREKFGTEERINNLLCIYYKELHNLSILKTKEQWEREGYQVFDTNLERYPAWGKPVSRVNKSTGEQYQFFPITHFYVPQAVCQA